MTISIHKLLVKMEEELRLAKGAVTLASQRERIHSIKTMCELVLDEPSPPQATESADMMRAIPTIQQTTPVIPQPRKLQMEEEANGDSLLDF